MIKSWPVHSGRNVTAAPFKVERENLNKKLPSALSVVGHLSTEAQFRTPVSMSLTLVLVQPRALLVNQESLPHKNPSGQNYPRPG